MSDLVRVTPTTWSARGEAVVHGENRQMLLFGGIPGEEATARVTFAGMHQVHAVFSSTDRPDAHRVEPPCERFRPCGGCAIMHLDPSGQEAMRRSLVRSALDEAGLVDVGISAFHPSPDGFADFRHVIKLGVGFSDHGHLRVGAWGRNNRRIVPIPRCNVARQELRATMASVAHHVIDLGIAPYDPETDRGVLRAIVLRASRTTGEVLITVVAGRKVRALQDLAEAVGGSVGHVVGIWLHLNSEPGNGIYSRDGDGAVGVVPMLGKGWIEEQMNGLSLRVGPVDFFQTNPSMAEVLYRRAVSRMALDNTTPVLDLYCGVGGIALHAAREAGFVIGVEENDAAVQRARENAHNNGLAAEFQAGRVEDLLPELVRKLSGARPVVSVNPARRGLEPGVVASIHNLDPRRVVYVSCNPRAMARDLAMFVERGYRVGSVELFDMFPNTPHVECIAVVESADPTPASRRAPRRSVVRPG
jgi:23S rRNA (uracil1939-C5)-methyltransferase